MTIIDIEHPLAAGTRTQLGRALFGHVIDGQVVPSLDEATMDVIDPSTGAVVARAASGSPADVDRAVVSARTAFDDGRWRYLAPMEKERRLRKLASLIGDHADTFAELDCIDAGLLRWYCGFIVQFGIDGTDYYAGWPSKMSGSMPAVPDEFAVMQIREPIGVIGMIVPWNGPTAVVSFVAAALAAGNCVVLKPAEQTPMSAVLIAELAVEAGIPSGVFNVVQGDGPTVGAAVVDHPGVDALSFTGSVATGTAIATAAAKRVKRVSLELGGKSPFIVFPDADLDTAAATSAMAVWGASGQVCTCGTRVLLHDDIHDEFVARIIASTEGMKIGAGLDPTSELGPLVSAEQLERTKRYVGIGVAEGAELALGGNAVGDGGYFHEPTVFTSVRNDMRIAQEEIFGPVMSVLRFSTEEEAYALANDTQYGLAAGVWTNDLNRAHRATRALRTGTVWVNTYQMVYPSVPYGGLKLSGHGRNLGATSLDELTQTKSVWFGVGGRS